jgi:hypothetical protein
MLVLACGSLLQATGLLLLVGLPLAVGAKATLLCAWCWLGWRDWDSQLRGYTRVSRISIDGDGSIQGIDVHGHCKQMRLLRGSLVLARIAWLRFDFSDRRHYSEMLLGAQGAMGASRDWHWLQLTWRQRGSRFGRID